MGKTIVGSPDIATLDSRIYADLCAGKFYVDVSPSVYIGSGADNVLGANVKIESPSNIVIKPYGDDYEINPGLSGGMDTVIAFNIPTIAGSYQTGLYKVTVEMFDSEGNSWEYTKTVKVCSPNPKNKSLTYGTLGVKMDGSCKDGKLYIIVDTPANYSGKTVSSQVNDFTLHYPTESEVDSLATTAARFSVQLYEGVYKLVGEVCAEYSLGDNVYARVKYKVKKEKNIRCIIDLCCVFAALKELGAKLKSDCTPEEKDYTSSQIFDIIRLVTQIQLSASCDNEDSSEYITELEKLVGPCSCNLAEGTPIINNEPATDYIFEGCGFDEATNGFTKTITLNNYTYVVEITANGGVLTITDATLEDCTQKQVITFNIDNLYAIIKTMAEGDSEFWSSLVVISEEQIEIKVAEAMACNAQVVMGVSYNGNNVIITLEPQNANTFGADIFLDGVFKGSLILDDEVVLTLEGAADGNPHTVKAIPKCSNNIYGTPVSEEFLQAGCPEIAPVSLSNTVFNVPCPFDLITEEGLDPNLVEVHNQSTPSANSLVDPTELNDGIYYVFKIEESEIGKCYSVGTKITVICEQDESCTAPQGLTNYLKIGPAQFFRFSSAAYPPPDNSYTAKRRLASDPDEPGSYTTLDTPTWNASANKWQFSDTSWAYNTLYVYRVESNCGGSPATTPYVDFEYAIFNCAGITETPGEDFMDYSFPSTGSVDIDKYEVSIYDSTGNTLIHIDTHTPAFSDPITGTFDYLEPDTTYLIKIKACIGDYCKTNCVSKSVTTLPAS